MSDERSLMTIPQTPYEASELLGLLAARQGGRIVFACQREYKIGDVVRSQLDPTNSTSPYTAQRILTLATLTDAMRQSVLCAEITGMETRPEVAFRFAHFYWTELTD